MSIKDPQFLRDMQGQPIDPGRLETLGKEAAALAETCGLSMSEAVVQTIGKTKLNAHQVRRVVEFANHTAFDRKYASMNSSMRVVDIEGGPADPRQVLQDLNDGARPEHTPMKTMDYLMPPEGKVASVDFGLGPISTDNSAIRGRTLGEINTLRHKLAAAHEEVTLLEGSARFGMNQALATLQNSVRSAVKTAGLTHEELQAAWNGVDHELTGTALRYMGPLPTQERGVKVARQINPSHPVVSGYGDFARFAKKYAQATLARKDLERQLVEVEEFLTNHRV